MSVLVGGSGEAHPRTARPARTGELIGGCALQGEDLEGEARALSASCAATSSQNSDFACLLGVIALLGVGRGLGMGLGEKCTTSSATDLLHAPPAASKASRPGRSFCDDWRWSPGPTEAFEMLTASPSQSFLTCAVRGVGLVQASAAGSGV